MATKTKSLVMPNGAEFEFYGATWYGVCETAQGTQRKSVSIPGFDASNLIAGTRVVVFFRYRQYYNGAPTLDVNGTGGKAIITANNARAGQFEWNHSEVVAFVYDGQFWVIENGNHATTNYWGRTRLSSAISNDATTALTPKAVYDAGYITSASLPTKVSDLTNDSGFLTLADLPIYDGSVV